jgi:hypothetical protein
VLLVVLEAGVGDGEVQRGFCLGLRNEEVGRGASDQGCDFGCVIARSSSRGRNRSPQLEQAGAAADACDVLARLPNPGSLR